MSEYLKLSKSLKDLRRQYKNEPTEELLLKIDSITTILKKHDAAIGVFSTPFGNYNKALRHNDNK